MLKIKTLMAVLLMASMLAAQTTQPVKTDFTNHERIKLEIALHRRMLLNSYEKTSTHNPAWDNLMKDFLDTMASYLGEKKYSVFYREPGDRSVKTMLALCEKINQAKCNDPLFYYCYGALNNDNQLVNEAARQITKALPRIIDGDYPAFIKFDCAFLYHYLTPNDAKKDEKLIQLAQTTIDATIVDAFNMPVETPQDRRSVFKLFQDLMDHRDPKLFQPYMEKIFAQSASDTWLMALSQGYFHMQMSYYDNDSSHPTKARAFFQKAYELEPSYPEAAGFMLIICRLAGEDASGTVQEWFDRAINAQIDFRPAWEFMANYRLQNGGLLKMYEVGLQAMKTGRYDTQVPYYLIECVHKFATYQNLDHAFTRDFSMWSNLQLVCEGYLNQDKIKIDKNWIRSIKAAIAFQCGEYAAANQAIVQCNGDADVSVFEEFYLDPPDTLAIIKAIAADSSGNMLSGYQHEIKSEYADARQDYDSARTSAKGNQAVLDSLERHDRICTVMIDYQDGRAAPINAHNFFDMLPWIQINGDPWKIENDMFVFTGGKSGEIRYQMDFKEGKHIRLEWMWNSDQPDKGPQFGVGLLEFAHGDRIAVLNDMPRKQLMIHGRKFYIVMMKSDQKIELAPNEWHRLDIEHYSTHVTISQDDQVIYKDLVNNWLGQAGQKTITLFASCQDKTNTTIKVRNITVEKPKQLDTP